MNYSLELETHTIFRGPLAEKLVRFAKQQNQPPVEYLADLVERALGDLDHVTKLDFLEALNDKLRDDLDSFRNQNNDLRSKLRNAQGRIQTLLDNRPPAGALPVTLSLVAIQALHREASIRHLLPATLVSRLVDHITTDNLFAAVLDTE